MSCRNSQEGEISIRFSAISKIAIGGWRRRYGGREAPAPIGEEAQPAAIGLARKTAEAITVLFTLRADPLRRSRLGAGCAPVCAWRRTNRGAGSRPQSCEHRSEKWCRRPEA